MRQGVIRGNATGSVRGWQLPLFAPNRLAASFVYPDWLAACCRPRLAAALPVRRQRAVSLREAQVRALARGKAQRSNGKLWTGSC